MPPFHAGTALGDPIEIGALAAVTCNVTGTRALPLELAAAKSRFGHAETAAGALGAMLVATRMMSHQRSSVVHLVSLNPYVSSIFDSNAESAGVGGRGFTAARQAAPGLAMCNSYHSGCSAFAFQGTNAHAVITSQEALSVQASPPGQRVWQHRRLWYQAPMHRLLHRVFLLGNGVFGFDVDISKPSLAFMLDHQVGTA